VTWWTRGDKGYPDLTEEEYSESSDEDVESIKSGPKGRTFHI